MAHAPAGGLGDVVQVNLEALRDDTRCPICLGVLKDTRVVKDCLHRFCAACIEKSLRTANNECPACRTHLKSRRQLQKDEAFDRLVAALYGDVAAFEAAEEAEIAAQTRAHQAEWAQRTQAFEQQRARAGVQGNAGRAAKRPKWGDAYDDLAFQDLDQPPSESDTGADTGSDGDDERDDEAARRAHYGQARQPPARAAVPVQADPGPYGAVPPTRLEPSAAAAAAIAAALAPAATFPDAVALGRMFAARVGPPTVVHLELHPLDAASVPAGCMALPALQTPHVVVPASMQAAKLGQVLALHVDMADEVAPGTRGALRLRDGPFPVAEWVTCLQLKQRADARGVALRLSYFYERLAAVPTPPPAPAVQEEQAAPEQAPVPPPQHPLHADVDVVGL